MDDAPPQPTFRGFGWLVLLVFFTAGITMCLLLSPFDFQPRQLGGFLAERHFSQIHKMNLALNLILFIPLGLVSGWAWKILLPGRSLLIVLLVAVDAAILSLIGEYLQMWLPERTSSLLDLVANVFGSVVGGVIGVQTFSRMAPRWIVLADWLGVCPLARRALIVGVVVLLARTAPFDVSFETYYLRTKYQYETLPAGLPFSATQQWLLGETGAGRAAKLRRDEAMKELARAGLNFAMFAVLAFAVTRAVQEHRANGGKRGGIVEAAAFCMLLVLVTEALQLPVRSRLMDMTDPVAGAIGVALGCFLAMLGPQVRPLNIRQT